MPYRIEKWRGRKPWAILDERTGRPVGFSETKAKAQASARARMGAERRTAPPKGKKRGWSWW